MGEPPSFILLSFIASTAFNIGVAALLILFSAVLTAAETACFALSPDMISLWTKSNNNRERVVADLARDPLALRVTLSILNILVKAGFVTMCLVLFGQTSMSAGFTLTTMFALIIGCDLLPRTYAKKYAVRYSRKLAPVVSVLMKICRPIVSLILKARERWKKAFQEQKPSREELSMVLELAAANDVYIEHDKEILRGIVNFGSLTVRDLMKQRNEISAINIESAFEDLVNHINRCGFSRIPVYKKNIDCIVGVIYVKDLLPYLDNSQGFKWPTILRPGFFVTESKKIDLLLKDFQEKRVHMAIVKDNNAKTSGLITLEDLIEEIIGEINEENDPIDDAGYRKVDDNTYIFDGKTPVLDFFKVLDHDIPFVREPEDEETLEEFIIELNDELPNAGDELIYEQLTFVIETVEQKRIKRVRVNVHAQA